MKKMIAAVLFCTVQVTAMAADFFQVDQEKVKGRDGQLDSDVTYLRAGKDFGNTSVNLMSRTARFSSSTISTSFESTLSNKEISLFGITPFVGVGYNFSRGGFRYGIVGASTGAKIGSGYAYLGAKTRVLRENATDPEQVLIFLGYALPLAKDVFLNLGVSRSDQDIKEDGVNLGLRFTF